MNHPASRLLAIAASLAFATAAVAKPKFEHANGSVALSDPAQFVTFNAFDYGATGDRGTVSYTNFEMPATGTGVWSVFGTFPLTVSLGGTTFEHDVTIDTVTPISSTATKFSGTGSLASDPAVTWTIKGIVTGSDITFTITYTGTNAGYTFTGTGTIGDDGSITGTATDSLLQSGLTFTIPAGSVAEVLSYTAPITCAVISGQDATFGFTVPEGFDDLSGTEVVAQVHDGGKPKDKADTWAHGAATGTCEGTVTNFPIVSGNIIVHDKAQGKANK